MSLSTKSKNAARSYQDSLAWAALISACASILGAMALPHYHASVLIMPMLLLTSAWAAICHEAEGLVYGRVVNLRIPAAVFLLLAPLTPAPALLLGGALLGAFIYFALLTYVAIFPRMELIAGDRFYRFVHPLGRLIPLAHFSPTTLSPVFEPVVAFHWSVEAFNIPIRRLSVFDPPALHNYIRARATFLSTDYEDWYEALSCFRRAAGLLNLLDTLSRFEKADLDGVALAASARLALAAIPENSRNILLEVLKTLSPRKRSQITKAFDLAVSNA